jgi:hypothetical protein
VPFVYFLRSANRLIKIGFSEEGPDQRLAAAQAGSPVRVSRLALLAGSRNFEQLLHARFDEHRSHCEWFRPALELRRFIREYATPWTCPVSPFVKAAGIPPRCHEKQILKDDPWFREAARQCEIGRITASTEQGKAFARVAVLLNHFGYIRDVRRHMLAKERTPLVDWSDLVTLVMRGGPLAERTMHIPRYYLASLHTHGVQQQALNIPGCHRYVADQEYRRDDKAVQEIDVYFHSRVR